MLKTASCIDRTVVRMVSDLRLAGARRRGARQRERIAVFSHMQRSSVDPG